MKPMPDHNLEQTLLELAQAEQAGVFRRTPLGPCALDPPIELSELLGRSRRWRLWVPLSAAALLVIGVWGALFQSEFASIREKDAASTMRVASAAGGTPLSGCMVGPGKNIPADCSRFDRDTDGDVDLADISLVQLADATMRR